MIVLIFALFKFWFTFSLVFFVMTTFDVLIRPLFRSELRSNLQSYSLFKKIGFVLAVSFAMLPFLVSCPFAYVYCRFYPPKQKVKFQSHNWKEDGF